MWIRKKFAAVLRYKYSAIIESQHSWNLLMRKCVKWISIKQYWISWQWHILSYSQLATHHNILDPSISYFYAESQISFKCKIITQEYTLNNKMKFTLNSWFKTLYLSNWRKKLKCQMHLHQCVENATQKWVSTSICRYKTI